MQDCIYKVASAIFVIYLVVLYNSHPCPQRKFDGIGREYYQFVVSCLTPPNQAKSERYRDGSCCGISPDRIRAPHPALR